MFELSVNKERRKRNPLLPFLFSCRVFKHSPRNLGFPISLPAPRKLGFTISLPEPLQLGFMSSTLFLIERGKAAGFSPTPIYSGTYLSPWLLSLLNSKDSLFILDLILNYSTRTRTRICYVHRYINRLYLHLHGYKSFFFLLETKNKIRRR